MDGAAVEHCRRAVATLPGARRHKAAVAEQLLAVTCGLRTACWLDFCVLPQAAVQRLLSDLHTCPPFAPLRAVLLGAIEAPLVVHLGHLTAREQQGDLLDDVQLVNVRASLSQPRLAEDAERRKCQRVLRRCLDALHRRAAAPPVTGEEQSGLVIPLDDSHATHSSLINGWLLGYPFVYVSMPHGPKSPCDHCLSHEELLAFKVLLQYMDVSADPLELLTFTVPQCLLPLPVGVPALETAEGIRQQFLQHIRRRLPTDSEAVPTGWAGIEVQLSSQRADQLFL